MNAPAQQIATREQNPSVQFRDQLTKLDHELQTALPPHIPVERFMRVVLTAVNGNPDLLKADRRSLFEAAMKAAQDGLLPDGRDGAFVTFSSKVQWMPMVGGILKKVRNSGDLLTIAAHVAYEKDTFSYSLGDDEKIEHIPSLLTDRGSPVIVYAVAKTKDGGIYREVMSIKDVEKVRNVSRAKNNGPWVQWWDEMAKKTVIRRLAKRLPMSSDLDDLIRRDDDMYDFQGKRAESGEQHGRVFGVIANPLADELPEQQTEAQREAGDLESPPASKGDEPEASDQGAASAGPGPTDTPHSEPQSGQPIQESSASGLADGGAQTGGGQSSPLAPQASAGLPSDWPKEYAAALVAVASKPMLNAAAKKFWAGRDVGFNDLPDTDRALAVSIFDAVKEHFADPAARDAVLRELEAV